MNANWTFGANWYDLMGIILFCIICGLLLRFITQWLKDKAVTYRLPRTLYKATHRMNLIFEPLAIITIAATFITIHPLIHGIIVLMICIFGYRHITNYLDGRIFRFDSSIQVGKNVSLPQAKGIISSFGPTSLYLKDQTGKLRIPYSDIVKKGYMINADPNEGGYYLLAGKYVGETEENGKTIYKDEIYKKLKELLINSPYAFSDFSIQETPDIFDGFKFNIRVGAHTLQHLNFLMLQLNEARFSTTIKKVQHSWNN